MSDALVQIATTDNQLIRVFPERNRWTPRDPLAFVGPPPLPIFRPDDRSIPVHVSCTFTWHREIARNLAAAWAWIYQDVRIGGPAFDDPGGEFTPGRYLKSGCTITSRGCPKRCGWCKVPAAEGSLRELQIKPGWIVQDNNLLACSAAHLEKVFEMLRAQDRAIYFNGGLDKHFLKPWHRRLFDSIKIGELWFACDQANDFEALERARDIFSDIPTEKMRCYTMIGYGEETIEQADLRIRRVFELEFLPFSQLYQPPTADRPTRIYSPEWKALNRKWSRPAAYRKPAEIVKL